MATPPPDDHPSQPPRTVVFYSRLSDAEPIKKLLVSLGRLCDRMGAGQLTIEQATEELERILTTLMGETL